MLHWRSFQLEALIDFVVAVRDQVWRVVEVAALNRIGPVKVVELY